jgi:WD40 repeat protein
VATGEALQTLKGHNGEVCSVAFSPNAELLVTASAAVRLWNVATGDVETLEGHTDSVSTVVFSPDGRLLASASDDATIRLWNGTTGAKLFTLEGPTGVPMRKLAFSLDGRHIAAAPRDEMSVWLWDLSTRAAISVFKGHSSRVTDVAFSPDRKHLASASSDHTVKLWDINSKADVSAIENSLDMVYGVTFSPDRNKMASKHADNSIRLWDVTTGATLAVVKGFGKLISRVAFSLDGKFLASASDSITIKLWEVATGTALHSLKHSDVVWDIAFSPIAKLLASASNDGVVKLWDTTTAAVLRTLTSYENGYRTVTFSPDGKLIASLAKRKLMLWEVATGVTLHSITALFNMVAFSPAGRLLASATSLDTFKLWDTATWTEIRTFSGGVTVNFSPDGKQLVSSERETITLWDVATGVVIDTVNVGISVRLISFSSDGSRIETDRGDLDIISSPSGSTRLRSGIFMKDHWIARGPDNILWIPDNHRPGYGAVCGNVVFLRHGLDCVSSIEFAETQDDSAWEL